MTDKIMLTTEELTKVCDRLMLSLRKKALRLKKKLEKDHNEKNVKAFSEAVEELYAFDKVIQLCGDLGRKILQMKFGGLAPIGKLPKKEDVN